MEKIDRLLWAGLACVVFVLVLITVNIVSAGLTSHKFSPDRSVEQQIVLAVDSYKTEYGVLPGDQADGRYDTPGGNAALCSILCARNSDWLQNIRKIVYFEALKAHLKRGGSAGGNLCSGFDPRTGVLLDESGHPYRIRLKPKAGDKIVSPYEDAPAPSDVDVIVWSTGEDGRESSAAHPHQSAGSDDILSWVNR